MKHPNDSITEWICPTTNEPFDHVWTNHEKEGHFNECPQCAPENEMSISERLAELNQKRVER